MDAMYLLLPISLVLIAIIIAVLVWAANSGQFDDLKSPAERMLRDDDSPAKIARPGSATPTDEPPDA